MRSMRRSKIVNLLARHTDRLVGIGTDDDLAHMTGRDAAEIGPYMHLGSRLQAAMQPVSPSMEFRSRLRSELMAAAKKSEVNVQQEPAPIWQNRWVLVGAAAGSVLSVAGVVTAVLLHQRSAAHSKL